MSLLVDMMTNTLDESYADAAARRQAANSDAASTGGAGGGAERSRPRRGGTVLVHHVVHGLLTGPDAAQVRKREAAASTVRGQLVEEVQRRTADSDELADQAVRLRREVSALQDAALRASGNGAAVAEQLALLQLATGLGPVTGPGLVVRLDDAPAGDDATDAGDPDRGGQVGAGRVLDRDLQDAANGLWAAGAEAVAINGLRLSGLTAIRSAGEAILVDYLPLSPPYTLRAIGDPGDLEAGFADGAAGRRLATLSSAYGLQLVIKRTDKQTLPGAGEPTLRVATTGKAPS
jgi:uncharacterized protein YlxW (UPF0749 family)